MTLTDIQPRRGADTRSRLLDLAETAVLEKGFAGTSIEELIVGAGITKSGFFYHFKDKGELAKALLERYLERENAIFDNLFARADALHDDPLHAFLIWLKLLAEMLEDLPAGHPGCLVASYCYQDQLFNPEVRELNREGVLSWRRRFRERLALIAERYPPRAEVDLDALADMVAAIVDGGIILSKVTRETEALPRQVLLYRSFIKAVFLGS
jgi:TetR/AcrR family transcriptional regulator, transcriptional repressor for nem operon